MLSRLPTAMAANQSVKSECRAAYYQCSSTPHLRSEVSAHELLTDPEAWNHEALFWHWPRNTVSGIIKLEKLRHSKVNTEQHWKKEN